MEQAKQSPLAFLSRLLTSLDAMLPTTLDVTDNAGDVVLVLHKPWFTWRMDVRATDRRLGSITRKIRIGKPQYGIVDAGGTPMGLVRGEDWRSRNFRFDDSTGVEFARVTKQWRGLFAEVVTDADSYAVTFSPAATDDQRALAFAGARTDPLGGRAVAPPPLGPSVRWRSGRSGACGGSRRRSVALRR